MTKPNPFTAKAKRKPLQRFGASSRNASASQSKRLMDQGVRTLPAGLKKGDRIKVDWTIGGHKGTFTGKLTEVMRGPSGDYLTIYDNAGVMFKYPVYLCDSVKKA